MPELFGKNPRYFVARHSYGNFDKFDDSIGFVVMESHTQIDVCDNFREIYENIREEASRIYWFEDQLRKQELDIVEVGQLTAPHSSKGDT
jgi:hypothetical protein